MLPFLSSELSSCRPPACRAYQIWHSYGHSYSGGCCLALSGLECQRMTSRPWPLLGVGCQSCLCCPLHPCHLPDGPDSLPEILRRSRPGTCFHNRPGALRRRGCPGSLPPACCCRGCPGNLPGLPDSCPGSCCPDSRLPGEKTGIILPAIHRVGDTRFELVTPSVSGKCATTAPTARVIIRSNQSA